MMQDDLHDDDLEDKSDYLLEAAVRQNAGVLIDMSSTPLLQQLTGRMCRIHTSTGSGTGFLISPDLIMTAYHVLSNAKASCGDGEVIHFSYSESVQGPEVEFFATTAENISIVAHDPELDYGVVRLPQRIGLARYEDALNGIRGWFSIPVNTRVPALTSRSLILLQFPLVVSAVVAPGGARIGETVFAFSSGEITGQTSSRRLKHNAATQGGSSGGLCLTGRTMAPFALHLGSNKQDLNFAIPLAEIITHIKEAFTSLYDELRSAPISLLCPRVDRTGRPILNRDELIARLVQMMGGTDQRLLYVLGASQSGRTFVKRIVESFRPHHLHCHVELHLHLDDYQKAVTHVAKNIKMPGKTIHTYDLHEPVAAYFRRTLDEVLISVDGRAQARRCVAFVYFDGLDVDTAVSRDLLAFLATFASRYPNLRICASGSLDPPPGSTLDIARLGTVHRDDYAVAARWFCTYHQLRLPNEVVEAIVEAAVGSDEIVPIPLAIQADTAHNLCQELFDLAAKEPAS